MKLNECPSCGSTMIRYHNQDSADYLIFGMGLIVGVCVFLFITWFL